MAESTISAFGGVIVALRVPPPQHVPRDERADGCTTRERMITRGGFAQYIMEHCKLVFLSGPPHVRGNTAALSP
jgi:hypothetical protein